MSRARLNLIILGIMLSMFLASMEGTVVATAMPTIVGRLGGLSIYSWVFAIFMLTSTTTVPIYGKLSDLYGRKRVYLFAMVLFLFGSVLCGLSRSMEQLIFFRAIQGLGAGGVLPLAFTAIGELFSLEQRARLQGLFSGIWGVSAIIGPLIGGFLVDRISWQWVFLINIVPGLLAVSLVGFAWQGARQERKQAAIDYPGAVLLTLGVLILLLGLDELGNPLSWVFLPVAVVLFAILLLVERRAEDPILPLHLFRDRLFLAAILHGVLAGWAMFGSLNYVPLFVQAVLGTSATQAGITLTPMSLSWSLASMVGGPLLLKTGYRNLALAGMVMLAAGTFFMALIGVHTSQLAMMGYLTLMGMGMGLSMPAFLIALQSTVQKKDLGIATSTLQFSRSIGGTLGVSVLGVVLSSRLSAHLVNAGIDLTTFSLDNLLDPLSGASTAMLGQLRDALAISIANLFIIALIAALLGLLAVLLAPPGKIAQLQQDRAEENAP